MNTQTRTIADVEQDIIEATNELAQARADVAELEELTRNQAEDYQLAMRHGDDAAQHELDADWNEMVDAKDRLRDAEKDHKRLSWERIELRAHEEVAETQRAVDTLTTQKNELTEEYHAAARAANKAEQTWAPYVECYKTRQEMNRLYTELADKGVALREMNGCLDFNKQYLAHVQAKRAELD